MPYSPTGQQPPATPCLLWSHCSGVACASDWTALSTQAPNASHLSNGLPQCPSVECSVRLFLVCALALNTLMHLPLPACSPAPCHPCIRLLLRTVRYLGCSNSECALCKHNPHKTCPTGDNFDEAYADNQVLRARCEADICVELVNSATGEVFPAPGVEVQVRRSGDRGTGHMMGRRHRYLKGRRAGRQQGGSLVQLLL